MMRSAKRKYFKMSILVALAVCLALVAGCASSPDSVEDPLSKYNNAGDVNTLPFATLDPALNTPTPAPTATWTPEATPDAAVTAKPEASGYTDLSYGSSGDAVSRLQGRLKALGYFQGTLDGKYGDSTASAVKLFQGQLSAQKTGIATTALQSVLFSSSAPRYNTGMPSDEGEFETDDPPVGPDEEEEIDYFDPVPTKKSTDTAPTEPTLKPLSRGAKGTAVSDLQRSLKALGYYSGSVDGDFGSGTTSAVKRFQKMYGQTQTGVATVALQKKLFSGDAVEYEPTSVATPKPTVTPKPTQKPTATPAPAEFALLEWGDSGADVTRLQRRLRTLGYMTGSADGVYGNATVDAITLFQEAIGAEPTGVATAALQRKLFANSAPEYEPKATVKPTTAAYVQLKPGDTGERVKELQRRLKALGYFTGEIGGNYMTLTTDAVKRFQKALGLEQTGIATVSLQRKLFSDEAPTFYEEEEPEPTAKPTKAPADDETSYSNLSEGDSGRAVERLQQRMKDLGFYSGSITGGFGKNTTAAVKAFQKAADLRQTGIATPSLQKLLFSNEAPDNNAPIVEPKDEPKYKRLKSGDTGEAVKALQRRLKALGYFDGDIGGNYLTKTAPAVKAFQKAIGWKQDGIATVDLQEKIFSNSAPSKSESAKSDLKALKYKDEGDSVYELQLRLIELGFLSGFSQDDEGTYGKATRAAVIEAQLARGSDGSDGNADLEFMRFIMSGDAEEIAR